MLDLYKQQMIAVHSAIVHLSDEDAEYRYASNKWSIKEVIGHLIDTERVCAYRMLGAARADVHPMQSFDEDAYVLQGGFHQKSIADLLDEWKTTRTATTSLLTSLNQVALHNVGIFKGRETSALEVACVILGHAYHHINILGNRYGLQVQC